MIQIHFSSYLGNLNESHRLIAATPYIVKEHFENS